MRSRGDDHPSPICGVGAIPSLSALRCRVDPIPICSVVPGRSHPSQLCVAGGDPIPLRSELPGRSHPSPLCVAGAIPSFFALRYRDDPTPLRYAVSGRDHPSPICSVVLGRSHPSQLCVAGGDPIPLRSALPGRSHPSPLYGIGTIPPLSAMRCRGETILLRFAVSG